MEAMEYCELWWSTGGTPQLTFYRPSGSETVAVGREPETDPKSWTNLQEAMMQLGMTGWELLSTASLGKGLFFKRDLQ